jgi:hypothetical protein
MNRFFKHYFSLILIAAVSISWIGCSEDEDPITPGPGDTAAVNYNNLLISERTIPFDQALSGVDLNRGLIVEDSSRYKDANLIDSIAFGDSVYYFRSGDLSDIPYSVPGYQTRFKFVMLNATQSEFDTMKVIPDTDNELTENDFTSNETGSFTAPLLFHTVYAFYLKGKFDNNVSPYRVFGLLYLDEAYNESTGFKLKFDVKSIKKAETASDHSNIKAAENKLIKH